MGRAVLETGRDVRACEYLQPHPEERRFLAARLEGWPLAQQCLLPSFETAAHPSTSSGGRPPQDEGFRFLRTLEKRAMTRCESEIRTQRQVGNATNAKLGAGT